MTTKVRQKIDKGKNGEIWQIAFFCKIESQSVEKCTVYTLPNYTYAITSSKLGKCYWKVDSGRFVYCYNILHNN